MIKLCIRCQWADVMETEKELLVFCQVKMALVRDISETCGRYERKTGDKR